MIKSRFSAFIESRRVIWLIGIVFAIVFLIKHFELPYNGILPSLDAASKEHVPSGGSLSYASPSSGTVNGVLGGKEESVKDMFIGQSPNSGNLTAVMSDPEDERVSSDSLDSSKDGKISSSSVNGSDYSSNRTSKPDTTPSPENEKSKLPVSFEAPPPDSAIISPQNVLPRNDTLVPTKTNDVPLIKKPSVKKVPMKKDRSKHAPQVVVTISQMNDMLLQSKASYRAMKPRWSSVLDQELSTAKSLIENTLPLEEPSLDPTLFRNVSMFKRSYELMEKTLKVYIYSEGERPIFHHTVLQGIYASEGWFMRLLKANKMFVTKKPTKAHLFYLPFSSRMLEEVLYVPDSHKRNNLVRHLSNYLNVITSKYPFWNRTGGADHFLVACHDWAAKETEKIMSKCIRALCNSDIVDEGFTFGKDVSLPETYVRMAKDPLRERGGKPPSKRHILGFFAGGSHGYLRPILLDYWKNDRDLKIFGNLPKKGKINYVQYMKSSKYCICAKGYEVNSPRVVEAIFYECVPVIISDNFVPPFFETLNWETFAVFVLEKDIPNLKDILNSIPKERYLAMQRRVKQVQRHFLWNTKPVKYDIFHMILHSIWYTRVFQLKLR